MAETFFKKVTHRAQLPLTSEALTELIRVYQDLERTLRELKKSHDENSSRSIQYINVRKLIIQLSRSKKKLERKINNTLLLEKHQFKRRFKDLGRRVHGRHCEGAERLKQSMRD